MALEHRDLKGKHVQLMHLYNEERNSRQKLQWMIQEKKTQADEVLEADESLTVKNMATVRLDRFNLADKSKEDLIEELIAVDMDHTKLKEEMDKRIDLNGKYFRLKAEFDSLKSDLAVEDVKNNSSLARIKELEGGSSTSETIISDFQNSIDMKDLQIEELSRELLDVRNVLIQEAGKQRSDRQTDELDKELGKQILVAKQRYDEILNLNKENNRLENKLMGFEQEFDILHTELNEMRQLRKTPN
jgi:hypothetical protein